VITTDRETRGTPALAGINESEIRNVNVNMEKEFFERIVVQPHHRREGYDG
jgi:hypothetical protein